MTTVDIQFSPANTDWPTIRTAAREAEVRGYGAIWVLDHLAGLPLEGTTMIEAFTLLGALAEATEHIELGTMVANVWNRQAGTLVSSIASVAIVADRQVYFGLGAGAAPGSSWAAEHEAVGAELSPDLATRHARVEHVLDLCEAQWRPDRDARFATFPLPERRPLTIVGVNSVRLATLTGVRADGINVQWRHPRRDEFIVAYERAVGDRDVVRTAYTTFEPQLLDPDHPDRVEMARRRFDRLVLAVFDDPTSWLNLGVAPNV